MLKFEGFLSNKKYIDKNKSTNEFMFISVHYYLKSEYYLQDYLDNNAKKMRTISDKRFINNVKIKRRVIHEI